MTSFSELEQFVNISYNNDYVHIISKLNFLSNHYGTFFLGDSVQFKLTDTITDTIIRELKSFIFYSSGDSCCTIIHHDMSTEDLIILIQLYEEYKLRKIRMNGLLRVIVFWLSPARKRAAEKVFHPNNMMNLFNEHIHDCMT